MGVVGWFLALLGWVWWALTLTVLVCLSYLLEFPLFLGVRFNVVLLKFELDSIIRSPVRVMPSFV